MFLGRIKRTSRDRESGLVFQWRLPVSSRFRFISAFGVVALLTAGLAASVRVRVGGSVRQPERRGSLVLVPRGEEWRSLEMLALEAGPIPLPADPLSNPAVSARINSSVSAASAPGYRYHPFLRPVPVEVPAVADVTTLSSGLLPPLPVPEEPAKRPPPPDSFRPVVLASRGIRAEIPESAAPAGVAPGNRYMLAYDGSGRVFQVTTLFSKPTKAGVEADAKAKAEAEAWLRQLRIEGGTKEGGWTAVEISSGT
jgi:hypothetical protein